MKLYIKILKFIAPYWKSIVVSIMLTFVYVSFNNLSLWVTVNFVEEIFSPEYMEGVVKKAPEEPLKDQSPEKGVYHSINSYIKDILIQEDRYNTLIAVCIVIFLSFLIKNIAIYSKRIILNETVLNIVVNFRNKLHNKMLRLPLTYFDNKHSGELTSIVFNNVNAIKDVLSNSFGNLILSPVQVIANIVIMFIISVELSLITFIVVPISIYIIVAIGQSMRRRSRRVFKQIADVLSTFQEAISSVRIVKAFTSEDHEIEKFNLTNQEWFKKLYRANLLKFATSPINEIVLVMMLVFLLWYGGNMVYSHDGLEAEDFLRFLIFLFTMFQPIKELAGINNVMQSGFAAAEKIFDILEIDEEVYEKPGAVNIEAFKRDIKYENVSFNYNKDNLHVLSNVSFDIKRGEMVAFVGQSGSGKTTLVNLLPRFYEAKDGAIYIDGKDIQDITLHSLRSQMSIVTQETILFNDSIRANISYGLLDVNEKDLVEAAKIANAWEFIEKMPDGFDTRIGERGTKLSGGQKQRVSIARAILKNPAILILDEATSALDTESERLVQEAIDNLLKSRTVLVIAHRLSTITNADKIVVLDNGKIDAIGSHSELLKTSELYKKLSENQFLDTH
jgi:ATP-binding cassette, subfamily B, bacterial MsbA